MIKFVRTLLILLGALYAALMAVMWALQDSLIFHPQPAQSGGLRTPAGWQAEELLTRTSDGIVLQSLLIKPPGKPAPVVMYFAGNSEEVSYLAQSANLYGTFAVLLNNYRGFGKSQGVPSEKALFDDALLLYDVLAKRTDVDGRSVHLHGRSLGTGVATYLATQRPVNSIVLTTPYDSIAGLAASAYPFVPVGLLLKHRFDSIGRAPSVDTPTLFLVAERDQVIPTASTRRLFDAWKGRKIWQVFPGFHHNDLPDAPAYWDTIAAFLATAPRRTPSQ